MENNKKLLILGVVLLFGSYYLYDKRKSRMNGITINDVEYDTKDKENPKVNESNFINDSGINQNKELTEPPMRVSNFSGGDDFFNFS